MAKVSGPGSISPVPDSWEPKKSPRTREARVAEAALTNAQGLELTSKPNRLGIRKATQIAALTGRSLEKVRELSAKRLMTAGASPALQTAYREIARDAGKLFDVVGGNSAYKLFLKSKTETLTLLATLGRKISIPAVSVTIGARLLLVQIFNLMKNIGMMNKDQLGMWIKTQESAIGRLLDLHKALTKLTTPEIRRAFQEQAIEGKPLSRPLKIALEEGTLAVGMAAVIVAELAAVTAVILA